MGWKNMQLVGYMVGWLAVQVIIWIAINEKTQEKEHFFGKTEKGIKELIIG